MGNIESITNNVSEKIREKFNSKGIQLVSIATVILPEAPRKKLKAVFDSRGVTVFDYDENEQLEEFGDLKWEDFSKMKIKHFKSRTRLTFYAEDRFRVLSIIDGSGYNVEEFLKEYTPVNVNVAELKWYNKIPGFRSETSWKMIMGSIIYLWILGTLYNLIFN